MIEVESAEFDVVVQSKEQACDEITLLGLTRVDGTPLPNWTPGAHIDLILRLGATQTDNLERQYSLCGDPDDSGLWRVGILLERDGGGGSVLVHDQVTVGQCLRVRGPRNHFAFDADDADPVLFIAGGIGITPILPMVHAAARADRDWQLVYAGRSRAAMAFVDELDTTYGDHVIIHAADESNRIDLDSLLACAAAKTLVYCCGPRRMIDAVESACATWPTGALHLERFEPKPVDTPVNQRAFQVQLELSGFAVTVPADKSILEVVEEAGVLVASSCREGTCGTCETPVISGEVDHRDSVLTPDEKASNSTMMVCVSRSACPRLVLEL